MRGLRVVCAAAAAVLLLASSVSAQTAGRKHVHAVGSSTVYPFTKAVAQTVAASAGAPAPVVEATGTSAGFAAFCGGTGDRYPDIANASRRMQKSEFELCLKNGIREIVEIPIGVDGIAVVRGKSGPAFKLTSTHLFLALAKDVPDSTGQIVRNPFKKWSQIDASLPDADIAVIGPSATSGTHDLLHELLLKKGAEALPTLAALRKNDRSSFDKLWHQLRTDRAYAEVGEGQLEVFLSTVKSERSSLAILGYALFQKHKDKVATVPIDGVEPTYDAITANKYVGARRLYVYLNKAHVALIPQLEQVAKEFVSVRALGENGYLLKLGLLPPQEAEFMTVLGIATKMTPLSVDILGD
jgi:phosphate transport system substrate-binding protein